MLALYPDEEVERASRCHGHQQKVIANRHEFDTYPLDSTIPTPGFRWKPGVFCTSSMYSQPILLDQELTRNSLQTRATKNAVKLTTVGSHWLPQSDL